MPNRLLEELFVTEGVPAYTFVKPPNYGEIFVDIRREGKPVIIEGQSGTGKTTCIRKVLEQLGDKSASYLSARKAADVSRIESVSREPVPGIFVIDDFHRLANDLQDRLANLAKIAAEEANPKLPKLVLIGINEIGSELIQLVPDIAKRTGIHRIQPGDEEKILNLISAGCTELNIQIKDPERVYGESKGDYWLTQQLCQTICTLNETFEEQPDETTLDFDVGVLRGKVVERLKSAYYPAVKEFCRGQRFRPTNDPYYKLLKLISSQDSSIVDLNMIANAYPDVRGSINNIKQRRIGVLLETKPICAQHFYYNSDTKSFAIDDPALFYFLRHLDWDELRTDCGFRESQKDYEFDIAISFAGENRELARAITEQLEMLDTHVFFDENFDANYLGRAWRTEFDRIFSHDSRLVVCLLDSHHNEKMWTTFERECFRPRVADASVIPIMLDDTKFVGIPDDIVGIHFTWNQDDQDWKDKVTDDVVFKIIERLSL